MTVDGLATTTASGAPPPAAGPAPTASGPAPTASGGAPPSGTAPAVQVTSSTAPGASPADPLELRLLYQMLLVRRFEERCVELYSAGLIRGFLHVYIGEEAVATGVLAALEPDDAVVATYREHGHALLKGMSARSVMAEMHGRVTGCARGRGGSMHLFDAASRFYGGNGIVAGGLPLAVGLALADRMAGRNRVTVCFFGEGAMAEGEFHESLNLAALWGLPVLFVCENNLYAMGTALARSESETNLAIKASSYEVPAWSVDGMDVRAVAATARRAVEAIRAGSGPFFLEAKTFRFRAHSMFDPERYRQKSEVEAWKRHDPIQTLHEALTAQGVLSASDVEQMETSIAAIVEDSATFAADSPLEDVADLELFVHSQGSSVAHRQPSGEG